MPQNLALGRRVANCKTQNKSTHRSLPGSPQRQQCAGAEKAPRHFLRLPRVEAGGSPATRVSKGEGNEGKGRKRPRALLPTWGVGFWAQLGAGVGFLLCDTWPSSCVPTQDAQSPPIPGSCSGPQHPEPSSPRPGVSASSKHSQAGQHAELSRGPQSRGCLRALHRGRARSR